MRLVRILLIDDDHELVRGLRLTLQQEGYDVTSAANGVEGLNQAHRLRPDLIILDFNMPWLDGLEVCHRLRQDADPLLRKTPILFLTSRNTIEDRVAGLDEGADDYLSKPFDGKELCARVRALLRRVQVEEIPLADPHLLQVGDLVLDMQGCWVRRGRGPKIQLTPAEYELLYYLMSHPNQPFSSQDLLARAWAYEPGMADPSLPRWHIKNLRTKIEPDPANPVYIRTVPRFGYMLETEA